MDTRAHQVVQAPAVAGLFYPADGRQLEEDVDRFLLDAETETARTTPATPRLKALIAPHAGYVYSGAIAAAAYARLIPCADEIRRVIIFAPAHRFAFSGMAVSSADEFSTPIGRVPLDVDLRQELLNGNFALNIIDEAFQQEHALEVQLPFLQRLLQDFQILPILVGDVDATEVSNLMLACWGGRETLIVVSSDLSHFHDYATAERMDQRTTSEIEALHPEEIGHDDACGRTPIKGLLLAAQQKDLHVQTVARCNSGDTGGDRQRVVGYGAYVFS